MSREADVLTNYESDVESVRIARTVCSSNTGTFVQARCAFANNLPLLQQLGYLIIGVDYGAVPSGLQDADQLLQHLGELCSDRIIRPLPVLAVSRHAFDVGEAAVQVVTQPIQVVVIKNTPPITPGSWRWTRKYY